MNQKENSNLYWADAGKMFVHKSSGRIMGDAIHLGKHDSIENYDEREFSPEERASFFERIRKPDPKKLIEEIRARINARRKEHEKKAEMMENEIIESQKKHWEHIVKEYKHDSIKEGAI